MGFKIVLYHVKTRHFVVLHSLECHAKKSRACVCRKKIYCVEKIHLLETSKGANTTIEHLNCHRNRIAHP